MTSKDIALEMLITRALDKSDQKLMRLMTKRVGVALRTQRENGLVEASKKPGLSHQWHGKRIFAVPVFVNKAAVDQRNEHLTYVTCTEAFIKYLI